MKNSPKSGGVQQLHKISDKTYSKVAKATRKTAAKAENQSVENCRKQLPVSVCTPKEV